MLRIRLSRQGRKKRPFYRIILANVRSRRDGAPVEFLGYYNPLTKELKLDKAKALAWIAKGAQPSDTAKRLIDKAGELGEVVTLPTQPKLKKKEAPQAEAS